MRPRRHKAHDARLRNDALTSASRKVARRLDSSVFRRLSCQPCAS